MKQETLKYLRVLIPGLLFLVGCIPYFELFTPGIMKEIPSIKFSYITLVSVLIGSIYYQLKINKIITNFSFKIFGGNINNALLKIYDAPLSDDQKTFLKSRRRLRDVFYNIIDHDNSLTIRAKNIYFNGIFWSSSADTFLISLLFIIIYCVSDLEYAHELKTIFIITAIISFLLHILSVNRHVELQQDQIDYIKSNHFSSVKNKINDLLQQMP